MLCELSSWRNVHALRLLFYSYGVTAGAEAFASSIASGMEGVVVSTRVRRLLGECLSVYR